MDLKGEFHVLEFIVGKRKNELSYARLLVRGNTKRHLEQLLESIYIEGAQPIEVETVKIKASPKNMVLPADFYSTTNNITEIYYNNRWIPVENMMMDKCIVLDTKEGAAYCKMIREVKRGDMIVVGEKGIKIIPQERPEGLDIFQFMRVRNHERPAVNCRKIALIFTILKKWREVVVWWLVL